MKSVAACLVVYCGFAWLFAQNARPNADEGMYLLAAQRVAEGELPYRDFPFPQAPLLAYAYAAAPRWDGSVLLGGRLLSLCYGIVGMAAALWLARRVAGPLAAALTLLLSLSSLPLLWVSNSVRAQSPATPLLLAAAASLALPLRGVGLALPASLALWSSGVRLTNLSVFALLSAWAAWRLRADPGRLARAAALLGVQGLIVFAPALRAPGDAWFHVVRAQLDRGSRLGFSVELGPVAEALRRLGAYADLLVEGWVLLAAAVVAAGLWLRGRGAPAIDPVAPVGEWRTATATLALLGLAALVPHFVFETAFAEYLVASWALLAPASGIALAAFIGRAARPALSVASVVALAAVVVGQLASKWEVYLGTDASSFTAFRSRAATLASLGGPDCTALSFETHLVAEAGCRVLPGMECSHFSFHPDLDAATARARGLLSPAIARERVAEHRPDWIALTPTHSRILAGARIELRGDRMLVPRVGPLAFLGRDAAHYRRRGKIAIPSGVPRPEHPDTVALSVYSRR